MIIFLGNDSGYEDMISKSRSDTDIVVSCQYRYKVPQSLVKSHTCINIHYGILPQYAGCNPIYWQIMNDTQAGVTLHYIDEGFDSGDVIDIHRFNHRGMTADEVYKKCKALGLELFKKYYRSILDKTAPRTSQDLTLRRYYPKDAVDFSDNYASLTDSKLIRALHFEGKQYPIIHVDGVEYEVRRRHASI